MAVPELSDEMERLRIPPITVLESDPPVFFASKLALREGNYKKPIYRIHKWWARRLGSVFRSILLSAVTPDHKSSLLANGFFYKKQNLEGLVLLDPFVGGGTSVVEAAKCNANVIGVDIDPVACFVTSGELESTHERALAKAFQIVEEAVKEKLLRWYRTELDDGRRGTIIYTFWVDQLKCPNCRKVSAGHPHYQLSRDQRMKRQTVFCSSCNEITELSLRRTQFTCETCTKHTRIKTGPISRGAFTCPCCRETTPIRSLVNRRRPIPQLPFALEVMVETTKERVYKKVSQSDLALYNKAKSAWAERKKTERFVPRELIPKKDRTDPRPISYGYRRYRDLFNARQLLCLSILAESISNVKHQKSKELLALAFSDCLAANNMFCFYAFDYHKLTPLFGLHAYTKVSRPVENNVWGTALGRGSFEKCFQKLLRGKQYAKKPYEYRYSEGSRYPERVFTGDAINSVVHSSHGNQTNGRPYAVVLNQSSERLTGIMDQSVDLVLTDPPYYDNLAYAELSDFYHVWLKRLKLKKYAGNRHLRTSLSKSLYVNNILSTRATEHDGFVDGLSRVFSECKRVLKDTGLCVFTFHHNSPEAWSGLAASILRSGFRVTNVFPVRSEGQSQFHSSERNLKWDVVFCCRKPTGLGSVKSANKKTHGGSEEFVRSWVKKLKKEGLKLGDADAVSLRRGYLVMLLSQATTGSTDQLIGFFS